MRFAAGAVLSAFLASFATAQSPAAFPDSVYAPLWNYNGTWKVTITGKPPDTLVNHCARTGLFFACEQVVNGAPGALVVFIPQDADGHYRTNPILKDGKAIGPGELEIKGNRWTYLGKSEENGKTTWYRTTNEFSDDSHIHFEQAQSTDDKTTWQVQRSGDEIRLDKGSK